MSASKIPSTKKSAPTTTNFSKGINTYLPNDILEYEQVRIAQNVRFDRIGEYKTRIGLKEYTAPDGLYTLHEETSSNTKLVSTKDHKFYYTGSALGTSDRVYSVELNLKPKELPTDSSWYHVIQLTVWKQSTSSSTPYEIGKACAQWSGPSENPQPYNFVFPFGLKFSNTDTVYFTIGTQAPLPGKSGELEYQALVTNDANEDLICEINAAPFKPVIGMYEANIELGTDSRFTEQFILYATKDSAGMLDVYSINPDESKSQLLHLSTSSLPREVKRVRFSQNMDEIRFVYGDAIYKSTVEYTGSAFNLYSWTTEPVETIDLQTDVDLGIKASNILTGTNDNIMYFDANTNTQAVWTNPHNLEWAKPINYTTTATIKAFVVGETNTTILSKSVLEAVSDDHLVDVVGNGDIVVDENDNYGEVTDINGDNITLTSISHAATAINSYDKFDRDFRQNFPSIKTGDPLTAMFNLGGIVFVTTRHHKYYLWSQTADVFGYKTSAAQHGTFSQESVACDLNYAYYACDDGIYVFNGSTESSITDKTIQNVYNNIPNKESIVLELYNNRLYVFFNNGNSTSAESIYNGYSYNTNCLVYNINLKVWESIDTNTYINATLGRASNHMLCGSSIFGQLYEFDTANRQTGTNINSEYADLGSAPIDVDIATGYLHFGTPSQLHRITKWRPEFGLTEEGYSVHCGYSLDFTDIVKYAFSIDLKDRTYWNQPWAKDWDKNGIYYGGIGVKETPTKLTTIPKVYNQFRRCQIHYQHHAAFEPISFKSHTLCCQTQRIR